jgi:hypothetical protein
LYCLQAADYISHCLSLRNLIVLQRSFNHCSRYFSHLICYHVSNYR